MEISLWTIRRMSDDEIQDTMELTQMLSFLHHDGIPEEIFTRHGPVYGMEEILARLEDISLVYYSAGVLCHGILSIVDFIIILVDQSGQRRFGGIHMLMHTWARDRLRDLDEE
jgi:hypothetical protein